MRSPTRTAQSKTFIPGNRPSHVIFSAVAATLLVLSGNARADHVTVSDIDSLCSGKYDEKGDDPCGKGMEAVDPVYAAEGKRIEIIKQTNLFCGLESASPQQWADAWSATIVDLPKPNLIRYLSKCNIPRVPRTTPSTPIGPVASASSVLWGVTDFAVSRARDELQIWLYDNVVKKVCESEEILTGPGEQKLYGKALFPETCALLSEPMSSVYLGGALLIQAAFQSDLKKLPVVTLEQALAHTQPDNEKQDTLRAAGYFALIVENLLHGMPVIDSIANFDKDLAKHAVFLPDCQSKQQGAITTYSMLTLLASLNRTGSILKLPDGDKGSRWWMMAAAVNMGVSNVPGLMKECAVNHRATYLNPDLALLTIIVSALNPLAGLMEDEEIARGLGSAGSSEQRRIGIMRLVDGILDIASISVPNALRYLHNEKAATQVADRLTLLRQLIRSATAGKFWDVGLTLLEWVETIYGQKLPTEVHRLFVFAIDMLQAKDVEGAKGAITRFSAPQGSYKRKRQSGGFYINVNAYVGGAIGAEWGKQQDDSYTGAKPALAFGPWLPIGLELGYSLGSKAASRHSLGLFVHALDLGALAYWRITTPDDQLQNRPEVGFMQVFSPGAFVMWGLPKVPVSLGLGAAWAPRLRSLVQATSEADQRDAIRLNFTAAVDLPIFP